MAAPSKKKQKTRGTEDAAPACMFCGHTDTKHVLYGQFLEKREEKFAVHQSCLMFSCGSGIKNKKNVSLNDVLIKKIRRMVTQAEERACTVCNIGGATVTCCLKKCTEHIHYPCGLDSEFLFQHFGTYKTYCLKHRPVQHIQPGNEDASCAICLDELTPAPGNYVIKTPCCKNQWLHRACLQTLALNAGKRCLRCPICKNKPKFCRELQRLGIYVPDREPSWEQQTSNQPNTGAAICDILPCFCVQGRRHNEPESEWEIIRCSACRSVGTHVRCSNVKQGCWKCKDCSCAPNDDAGEGSSQSSPQPSTSAPPSLPSRRRRSSDSDTEEPPAKKRKS